MSDWYIVSDPKTGKVIEVLNENNSSCPTYGSGYCGGCDRCLIMQARHSDLQVKAIDLEPHETLADALGRILGSSESP